MPYSIKPTFLNIGSLLSGTGYANLNSCVLSNNFIYSSLVIPK